MLKFIVAPSPTGGFAVVYHRAQRNATVIQSDGYLRETTAELEAAILNRKQFWEQQAREQEARDCGIRRIPTGFYNED